MVLDDEHIFETSSLMENVKTLRFCAAYAKLQLDQWITECCLPNNSSRQSRIYLPIGTNDFSLHKPVSGGHKSICTKNHHLVVSFESEIIVDLETGDDDMRKIEE